MYYSPFYRIRARKMPRVSRSVSACLAIFGTIGVIFTGSTAEARPVLVDVPPVPQRVMPVDEQSNGVFKKDDGRAHRTDPQSTSVGRTRENTKGHFVSLKIADSTIKYVVNELVRQTQFKLLYDGGLPVFTKRIAVNLSKVDIFEALTRVLQGTDLQAHLAPDGETIVIRSRNDGKSEKPQPRSVVDSGKITGYVTDSATGNPVGSATVTLLETNERTLTTDRGEFTFRNVVPGEHHVVVKIFGYRTVTRVVGVTGRVPAVVRLTLAPLATQLSGVVTTATGMQRRVEVGNDLTVINVDSVMKNMPVTTLTDLLATRVPGLYAAPVSGEPGAATRIRVRGVSSIQASNDPIVIVDGVQVYAQQIELRTKGNLGTIPGAEMARQGNAFALSPLDQIDLNSTQSVEVLKGPSAVAMYGSDAANGVIIITTKRGRPGPLRWGMSGDWGTTYMPGKWPMNWYAFGHYYYNETGSMQCRQGLRPSCIVDSVISYQILNDPSTTIFDRGTTQGYSGNVSGGKGDMVYSLTGSMSSELGLAKLPNADVGLLRDVGIELPNKILRPQANDRQSGTATVMMEFGKSTATFTTTLNRQLTRSTPLSDAISKASSFDPPRDVYAVDGSLLPRGSGLMDAIPDFRRWKDGQSIRSRNSLGVKSNFLRQVTTEVKTGFDVTNRLDRMQLGSGECYVVTTSCDNRGSYWTQQGYVGQTDVSVGASMPLLVGRWFTIRNSVGGNYLRSITRNLMRQASGLPVGATSGNGAETESGAEVSGTRNTAGVYFETNIGIADRFFLPLAIRRDASSTFGSKVAPQFPRLSFAYSLSDEPFFQALPISRGISVLKLRLAYGQAGKQPSSGVGLRTYNVSSSVLDGQPVTTVSIYNLGNPVLKPERSRELEGGVDILAFRERVDVTATWYHKKTSDLLTDVTVPPSVYTISIQRNTGDLLNRGFDLAVGITMLQRHALTWRSDVSFSRSQNKLTKLIGSGVKQCTYPNGGGGDMQCLAVGFPLLGRWTRPIVGYADRNLDDRITEDELLLSDSAVFVGAPYPKFTSDISQSMTLLGRITLGANLSYQNGLTQYQNNPYSTYRRENNDPTVPLAEQAFGLFSSLTRMQSVSSLRFVALSVGIDLPRSLTHALLPRHTVRVAVQGRNLGLWSTYRGKDPNVGAVGENIYDNGALPTPRVWSFKVGIN